MTLKNSFSEGALIRDGMRRSLWSIVLSALGFLITMLLPALMIMQRALEEQKNIAAGIADPYLNADFVRNNAIQTLRAFLGGGNLMAKTALIVLAVVCGVTAYQYLHARQKVDFYHSLPISRTRLFFNRFAVGLLCVWPVYLIVLALTLACTYAMGFGAAVDWAYIGGTILTEFVTFLLIYALTALTTIVCGNTIVSLLLLLWVLFGPVAAYALKGGLFDRFFSTYSQMSTDAFKAFRLCPVLQIYAFGGVDFSTFGEAAYVSMSAGAVLGIYAAAAVLVTVLGAVLFCKRKSERAGTALAFEPLKTPLKMVMCLMMGTAVGLLFQAVGGGFWYWVGLVIGAVLFHWLVEIIYAFDFHAIFQKPVHLLAVLAVLLAGSLLLRADVFGYDRWLPELYKIAAADAEAVSLPVLQTPENIAAVRRIAELGVEAAEQLPHGTTVEDLWAQDSGETYTYYTVSYRLAKGGSIRYREYVVPDSDEITALRRQIESSDEYKMSKWPLFTYDYAPAPQEGAQAQLPGIDLYTQKSFDAAGRIYDQEQVKAVIDALREEALDRPDTAIPMIRLELGYQEKALHSGETYLRSLGNAAVTDADVKTLAMIQQLTGIQPEQLTAGDINAVQISFRNGDSWASAEVTDPDDVAQLLRDAVNEDALRTYNDAAFDDALEPLDGIRVEARDYKNYNSYALRYPVGKAPLAVIEKCRAEAEPEDGGDKETWARAY